MLRTDFIEVVNSGKAWGFVGSGPSIDSGGPTWASLCHGAIAYQRESGRLTSEDARLNKSIERGDFANAFSRLVELTDRETVDDYVRSAVSGLQPGKIARAVANWPLAGLITTNYDSVLETALLGIGTKGWVPVGNVDTEVQKISGGAERVVWHVHGDASNPERSRLILTREDYDSLYLHESNVFEAMRGLLSSHRLVVVGFGFVDPEVSRMIRKVGKAGSPDRQIYAFLGGIEGPDHQDDREELRDYSNVDVIPYGMPRGDHSELRQLVDVYGSLIIGRSLRLNRPERPPPSWDSETTALLTYNELVLRHPHAVPEDVLVRVLRSRIIARLRFEGTLDRQRIVEELAERARQLADSSGGPNPSPGEHSIDVALAGLVEDGLVAKDDMRIWLTDAGSALVGVQQGKAELLREQFVASLQSRVNTLLDSASEVSRVTKVLSEFFEECMCKRGLGVALAWQGASANARRSHMTALLQHLPDHIETLNSIGEVEATIYAVEDILANPSKAEEIYLGMRMQAEFIVQLLAFSPELVATRARQMAETVFLLDSSVLIPLLAEGTAGHPSTRQLTKSLLELGATLATTEDFVQELAGHAIWASKIMATDGPHSTRVIAASLGRSGFRQNLFLAGFLSEIADGSASLDFGNYLDRICGSRHAHSGRTSAFATACEDRGIAVRGFANWEGFKEDLWADREAAREEIERLRRQQGNYRGDLQVRAEAGARVLIQFLRSGELGIVGRRFGQALFVSNSRVVDFGLHQGEWVTMRADSVLQWIGTLSGAPPDQLACLVDGLLWELAQDGFEIVDRERLLRVFAPTVDASVQHLSEQLEEYKKLSAEKYGVNPRHAFAEALDAPLVERALLVQRASSAEEQRDRERIEKLAAQNRAKLSTKEIEELARLRARQAERRRRAEQRSRAARSKPRKRRKK